ncbi:MAG: transcription elongation factor GreA [Epsilonproteobacteria bacterium]|nr:transcription elongation factor GreA [Campylobacterota bacterium]
MKKEPMTNYGFEKISKELKYIKEEALPQNAKEIDEARQLGDLKENAEYHAAREKQQHLMRRQAELSDILSKAVVIDPSTLNHNKVSFGSSVVLVDVDTDEEVSYTIVGLPEADIERGLISYNSPLAQAILGKEEGDEVEVSLPGGKKVYEIEKVEYKEIEFGN